MRFPRVAMPIVGVGATALSLVRSRLLAGRLDAAHSEMARDASFVELIESVSAATSQARTIQEAMFAAVGRICQWTGWPVGHVYVAGKEIEDPLHSSGVWHLAPPDRFAPFRRITEDTPLPTGVGLPGRVLASGRPAWIVDVTKDANFPRGRVCEDVGIRGAFSFPVVAAERCYAIIECFSLDAVNPDLRLLEVTAHIGRQLGRVIQNMETELALRDSETRFRSVAESATDAIVAADQAGHMVSWNRGAERIFGYTEPEVVGKPLSMLMPERFRAMHDAGIKRVVEGGVAASRLIGSTVEVVGLRKDGREFPLELSLATWDTPNGRFFSGIIRDISERKKAEDKIKALLETAPDPIVELDADARVVLANARTDELFGYERSEVIKRPIEKLFAERSRELVAERFHAIIAGADSTGSLSLGQDLYGQRKDGTEFAVDVTVSTVSTDDGPVVTSIIRDVTDRKRFEAQLKHLADHDALTDLFNRRRFEEELVEYADYAQRYKECGAVLLLDLDRFKYINDTHGHKAGDEVIRAVGSALRGTVRTSDVVARLGGDEFAILLKNLDRAETERIAQALLETVRVRQLPIAGRSTTMTTSIGIALFDDDVITENLLVNADLAMYAAKDAGGNRFEVSADDGEHLSGMQARLGWVDQIRRGLDEERFVLYCQPIMHLASNEITQWELLLRLLGEDGEMIPPAAFIPTAERFGLIQEIDRWVVGKAIEALDTYRDWPGGVRFEVNVSGKSMSDPQLLELVERELHEKNVDPSNLVFEITETAAIANMEEARAFADRLTALGCRFALDDFGAGFSSFYYLKYLPLNYLKIDGDFIKGMVSSATDQLVVQSMVDIARGMGMKTIAEFVEGPETAEMLHAKGVDYSQGYYHGRPRPVTEEFAGDKAGTVTKLRRKAA
ncbi:MAG TPA: EAL domain-containing protein [Solirubrobacteraceae bacterium]|nr:EAL domain-containing protein [Solirubrobacteraceae bacterium]